MAQCKEHKNCDLQWPYRREDDLRLWQRAEPVPFSYSDGDAVEEALLRTVASARDVAIGSEELRAAICDWPTAYHFSPQRADLLRPLHGVFGGRTLELGCGCGAITRHLGELGGRVVAVEGSARRARIAATRCRDLDNVDVVVDGIERFECTERFDAVTLIGVLEYARVFISGHNPVTELLARCRKHLTTNGILVLAIENQLGLKYFAGAPEDHLGQPFAGLHRLYGPKTAATFGRIELAEHLRAAGFVSLEWLYPFPDYKMPTTIFCESAFTEHITCAEQILTGISAPNQMRDYLRVLSEQRVGPLLVRNSIMGDLANSFLIVARTTAATTKTISPDTIGYIYSTARKRCYAKEAKLCRDGTAIWIRRRRLYQDHSKQGELQHVIADELWIAGRSYISELCSIVQRPAWGANDIARWAEPWLALLRATATHHDGKLPGSALDLTPFNMIISEEGLKSFDQEWIMSNYIPLCFVAIRGLFYSLRSAAPVAPPAQPYKTLLEATEASLNIAGLNIDDETIKDFLLRESALQAIVGGANSKTIEIALSQTPLEIRPVDLAGLNNKDREANELRAHLEKYHKALTQQIEESRTLHAEIAKMRDEIREQHMKFEEYQQILLLEREKTDNERQNAIEAEEWAELARARTRRWNGSQINFDGLRVLYITNRNDAPYRYRCVHGVEQLRDVGVVANIANLNDPNLIPTIASYSIIILFRIPWSATVSTIIDAAKKSGATVAYEVDDLIFDPRIEKEIPFLRRLPIHRQQVYREDFEAQQRTFLASDLAIGSTPSIALHARRFGKVAIVHPNLLSKTHYRLSKLSLNWRSSLLDEPLIGYMSGSDTHDGDLESVVLPLIRFLALEQRARLLLCGHYEIPEALIEFEDRVLAIPYQDWRVYPWLMTRCNAIIAPLEEINTFTNAKSALKVFEAGAFGIPTIASPSAPYRDAIRDEVSGFIARDEEQWLQALRITGKKETSLAMGRAAGILALAEHSQKTYKGVLATKLAKHAGRFSGPLPPLLAHDGPGWMHPSSWRTTARVACGALRAIKAPLGTLSRWQRPITTRSGIFDNTIEKLTEADRQRIVLYDSHTPLEECTLHGAQRSEGPLEFEAGEDPWFLLRPPASLREIRYLAIEMAARCDAERIFAQVFWQMKGQDTFAEERSIRFEVAADGNTHTYLIDLKVRKTTNDITGVDKIMILRFDPIDQPGDFTVGEVCVLDNDLGTTLIKKNEVVMPQPHPVDIIIPIYNARDYNIRCIESVLCHATGDVRLTLINDASTDERVAEDLRVFAAKDARVRVFTNDTNCGFVRSADRGMRAAEGRDVLLLNSDTEVFDEFLARLQQCAYADPLTGIVTPFSNNATIYSIPDFPKDNVIPNGFSPKSFAELIAACSLQRRPEMPTGVGFCLYIKNQILQLIGYFDVETFGRGYGEEDDFCQRARKAGYKVRLADDVFVYHKGRASFGTEVTLEQKHNAYALESKHPGYNAEIARFVSKNPLRDLHNNIHFHIKRRHDAARTAIGYILHCSPFAGNPGGTEHHVLDLLRGLRIPRAVIAYPRDKHIVFAEILDGQIEDPAIYQLFCQNDAHRFIVNDEQRTSALMHGLRLFNVRGVHIHHLMNWAANTGVILSEHNIPYVFTCHDYLSACPNWNLFNQPTNRSCDCTDNEQTKCLKALFANLSEDPPADIVRFADDFRAAMKATLRNARAVVFPSETARYVMEERVGALEHGLVIPHGFDSKPSTFERPASTGRLRIAAFGEVAHKIKGADLLVKLVAQTQRLPVEWHFFGDTAKFGFEDRLRAVSSRNPLVIHGPYRRHEILDKLVASGIDLFVGFSPWQETFSFTLSEAMCAGVPALVLDRGAPAERIRRDGVGIVIASLTEARDAISLLCQEPMRLQNLKETVRTYRHRSVAENARDYAELYAKTMPHEAVRQALSRDHLLKLLKILNKTTSELSISETLLLPPPYANAKWYPIVSSFKRWIPQRLRTATRNLLIKFYPRTMHAFELRCCDGSMQGLTLLKSGLFGRQYEASSNDPQIWIDVGHVKTASVKAIRFRMRYVSSGIGMAQFYWTHTETELFSEDKSISIPLYANDRWNTYLIDLQRSPIRSKWFDKETIHRLRFDPLDRPGILSLSKIELCE